MPQCHKNVDEVIALYRNNVSVSHLYKDSINLKLLALKKSLGKTRNYSGENIKKLKQYAIKYSINAKKSPKNIKE